LKHKYGVVFPEKSKEYDLDVKGNMSLFNLDELSLFIDSFGALDLDEYYNRI
jgi:hypothetical protein